jgi:3-oxosteroid 1-dehydrogenase
MLENLPAKWDMEADVVALGSGIGGLAAAITAHDNGSKAIVLERANQIGGVTALSLGEVWVAGNHLAQEGGIEDSSDSGFRYLKRLSMDYGDDASILNFAVHGRVALKYFQDKAGLKMHYIKDCPDYYYGATNDGIKEGRLLEVDPFPAATLGEWQAKTRVSPLVPYGMTHHDMFAGGGFANMKTWDYTIMADRLTNDVRCLGAGLAAYFVKAALDRNIQIETDINVEELIADGKRVVGVRATRGGKNIFVKADKGVVIAVSSYEKNQKLNKQLNTSLHLESMVFPTIDGANFRLAGPLGARVAKVPDITSLAIHVPGEEQENGDKLWRSAIQIIGLPHHIAVNRMGKRFGNEAFYRAICYAVDMIDGGTQTHPNFPCWAIFDAQAREKYPCGSVMPEQDLPEGLGVKADTIAELAQKAGIDASGLEATIAGFNRHAEKGEDPEFKRGSHVWSAWMCGDPNNKPHPNLGAIVKAPFYAVPMSRLGGSAIPSTGLVTDHHSRVVGWDDKPIEGLYAAGNSVARLETGANMQSGVSNGRGMTYGYLAGMHASGKPSTLLEGEIKRMGL